MFWKNKKVKELKEIRYNTLTIKTKSSGSLSWTFNDWHGDKHIEPWKHFYKWFFGRSSRFFVMRYKNGETCFNREDITSFEIKIETKLIEVV